MGLLNAIGSLFVQDVPDTRPEGEEHRAELERRTVLVIDDDQNFLDTTVTGLRESGFNVLKATTGPKGLNILRYAPQDIKVVLLDFDMPNFDGWQTLEFVRKLSAQAKVVGVTGVDPKFLPPSFRDGVDQLLLKPFGRDALVEILNAYFTPEASTVEN